MTTNQALEHLNRIYTDDGLTLSQSTEEINRTAQEVEVAK